MSASLDNRLRALRAEHLAANPPPFGHVCRDLYSFGDGYVELNNGSFGACPKYVMDAVKLYMDEAEQRPDLWFRFGFKHYLNSSRRLVADLVNCDADDLVLLNNATTGVNAVMRGFQPHWSRRGKDAIIIIDTIYGACRKTVQYIVDSNPTLQLQIVNVPIIYPSGHTGFLRKIKGAIEEAQKQGLTIRIAILDAISSLPGVVVPWEDAVVVLREYGILSLIDGAHAVGQVSLDLRKSDPDFFISNCHKWLNAHRGCAMLYTPKRVPSIRNQHMVPGLPTSHYYESPTQSCVAGPPLIPTDAASRYVAVWESLGTQDVSNFVSLSAAIDFRRWLGGEDAIKQYTSALAVCGGKAMVQVLGLPKPKELGHDGGVVQY